MVDKLRAFFGILFFLFQAILFVSVVHADGNWPEGSRCAFLQAAKWASCKGEGNAGDIGGCSRANQQWPKKEERLVQCNLRAAIWSACAAARAAYQSCFSPSDPGWEGHVKKSQDALQAAAVCMACVIHWDFKGLTGPVMSEIAPDYVDYAKWGEEYVEDLGRSCKEICNQEGPPSTKPGVIEEPCVSKPARPGSKVPEKICVGGEPPTGGGSTIKPKPPVGSVGGRCTSALMTAAKFLNWVGYAALAYDGAVMALEVGEYYWTESIERGGACDLVDQAKRVKDQACATWGADKAALEKALGCEVINTWTMDACGPVGVQEMRVAPTCRRDISCDESSDLFAVALRARKSSMNCAIMSRNWNRLNYLCRGDKRCLPPSPAKPPLGMWDGPAIEPGHPSP